MARLTSKATPLPSSTPFSLYGSRHKWLDSLPPFDGSSNKPAQVTLQDLMQLQALLASGHETTSHAHMVGVAQHVEECLEEELPGLFTLRLLTYPLTGKIQQVLVSTKSGFRSSGTKTECQFVEEYLKINWDTVPSI